MNKKETLPYNTDASGLNGKAIKIFSPKTTEEIQKIIKSSNFDIVPRGAGTNLVGGCVPNNSIVIDMGKMNNILNFNSSKRIVCVGAGITIKELNEKLNSAGFEFPIQPLNKGISTIGGMIATNAVGDKSMKYGRMKNWIEGVEFINGRGELIKSGKTDLSDICGMEGITGIIVSATLKIMPLIKRTASIFKSDKLSEILSIARRLKSENEIVMIELLPPMISKWFGFQEKYHLIIEFDSERGKIHGEEYNILMKLKNNTYFILASEGYYKNEDAKLFFDNTEEFITFLEDNQIPYVGFLGTGYIHPFFKENEQNKKEAIIRLIKKIGIKPTKYGIGLIKKDFIEPFDRKIMQRVKLRYDPFGKLNNNKVIDIDFSARDIKNSIAERNEKTGRILEEEKSACEIFEELDEDQKTPEEKMNKFIKEIEQKEVTSPEEKKEIEEKLKDYEYTFETEEEKRKKVEEFTKNIPKDIGDKKSSDYITIRDIMTNSYNKPEGVNSKEKEQFNQEIDMPENKIAITDNLSRKSKTSESEQDLINKIIGNRFDYKKENKNDN